MEYSVKEYKRCVVLSTEGRIDHYTAPLLDTELNKLIDAEKFHIVFDMSQVDFLASAGWWALINANKACRRFNRGEITLVGIQPRIRESMDLVGIAELFKIYDTITDAVGDL